MGKYFTRIEESGWAAYIDQSKTNAALYPFGVGNTEVEAVEWLENSILVLEDIALANGYVKLAHDEIVMPRKLLERMIREQCVSCHFDETELPNCGDCDIKPIRDRIKEATHERD